MVYLVNLASNDKADTIVGESVLNLKYGRNLRDYFLMLLFIRTTIVRRNYILGCTIFYWYVYIPLTSTV